MLSARASASSTSFANAGAIAIELRLRVQESHEANSNPLLQRLLLGGPRCAPFDRDGREADLARQNGRLLLLVPQPDLADDPI